MADDTAPDGYPDSSPEDLTPSQPALPLDVADRAIEGEDHVEPRGAGPADDEPADELFGSPDADQLAAIELGSQGSRHADRANFEDNEAQWSRERS